jgi:hypothetical protein
MQAGKNVTAICIFFSGTLSQNISLEAMARLLLSASVGTAGVCMLIFCLMSVGRPRGVQMLQEDLSLLGHEQQLAKAARIRRQIKTGVAHGTIGMGIGGAHPVPPRRICA